MSIPVELLTAAAAALTIIEQTSDAEYSPTERVKLLRLFDTLGTDTALRARQWLTIGSVYRIMRFYQPSFFLYQDTPRQTLEEFVINFASCRYGRADEVLSLAVRVMRGDFNRDEAARSAGEIHYRSHLPGTPLQSVLIEDAAIKALSAACIKSLSFAVPGPSRTDTSTSPWITTYWEQQRDVEWVFTGQSDTASIAAVVWSLNDAEITGKSTADAYNWWKDHPLIHIDQRLEFWRWWLLEALPEAWNMVERSED